MRISGSEPVKNSHRSIREHKLCEDLMKESYPKEDMSLPNNFHIEKEMGCVESVDPLSNDASDHQVQSPIPIMSVSVKEKTQRTDSKELHVTECEDSASINHSEEGRSDPSNVLNSSETNTFRASSVVEQSDPTSDKILPTNNVFNRTSKRPYKLLEAEQTNAHITQNDEDPLAMRGHNTDMVVDILQEKENSSSRGRPRKQKQMIKCEYCGRLFNHASAYVIHRRVHTGEKPFSCQDCGKAFAQLSNLRSHSKIHNTPKSLSKQLSSRRRSRRTVARRMTENQVTPNYKKEYHDKKKTPEACPVCGKVFPYKSVLKIHLRVHSGEKPYSCKVCGKAFTQACTVRIHERVHWSVKPFLCSKCGKGFSQIGTLKAHICEGKKHTHTTLKEMELSGLVIFKCHLCKKCFSTRKDYDLHLKRHTNSNRYSCDSCDQKYSLRSELDAHRKYCFSIWLSKTNSYNGQSPVQLENTDVEPSETVEDSQTVNTALLPIKLPKPRSAESTHQKHQTKPYKTLQSDFSLLHKKNPQKTSLLTCSPKVARSTCDSQNNLSYCQPFKASYFVSQLNSLDQKSDPRKYACPRCGRIFSHVGRLRAHMLTHARGKSFTCDNCGRILENWSKFWRHQRKHKQRRGRFFCPKCGQGFRFVGIYMKHLQQHPELNAYFCPLCPHTFSNAVNLRNHQQEWHGVIMPHICDICGKGFANPIILKRHRVAHRFKSKQVDTPYVIDAQPVVTPYECGKCDASFKTLDLLFNHQLYHSPMDNLSLSLSNDNCEQLNDFVEKKIHSPHHKDNLNFNDSTSMPDSLRPYKDVRHVTVPTDNVQTQTQQEVHNSDPQRFMTLPVLSSGSKSEERMKLVKYKESNVGRLECAECGARFNVLPALHEHYLEHARGEIEMT